MKLGKLTDVLIEIEKEHGMDARVRLSIPEGSEAVGHCIATGVTVDDDGVIWIKGKSPKPKEAL